MHARHAMTDQSDQPDQSDQADQTQTQPPPVAEPPAQLGGAATATRPAKPHRKVEHMPPWRVLLHNDDVNEVLFVVESIMQITPLGRSEAVNRMMEAHITGVAMLLVTHQERAELYRDQFHSKGLTVTIEPTES
jgi:ATP-dependent Clp protease adaptor protein ClpS